MTESKNGDDIDRELRVRGKDLVEAIDSSPHYVAVKDAQIAQALRAFQDREQLGQVKYSFGHFSRLFATALVSAVVGLFFLVPTQRSTNNSLQSEDTLDPISIALLNVSDDLSAEFPKFEEFGDDGMEDESLLGSPEVGFYDNATMEDLYDDSEAA